MTLLDRARDRARDAVNRHVVDRIWQRDPTLWDAPGEPIEALAAAHRSIASRLGWLDAPTVMRRQLSRLQEFSGSVRKDGYTQGCLLGMGGSSLCAEVYRAHTDPRRRAFDLQVIDTTDPWAIRRWLSALRLDDTLTLVSSKSGTTIEVVSLERAVRQSLEQAELRSSPFAHLVAITDPGTPLEELAERAGYRRVFLNPPDIGGRFSALSLFGLVPAALLGLPLDVLLDSAARMAEACHRNDPANPGLELGMVMAEAAAQGRDKLTLLLPPSMSTFGLWVEQLVAESTGKRGLGILPIVDEPPGEPDRYGPDRLFVSVETDLDKLEEDVVRELEGAGHPVYRITARTGELGAEFFRWEFAVAAAAAVMAINAFDEPDVRSAKDRTAQWLDAYVTRRGRTDPTPQAIGGGVSAWTSSRLSGATPTSMVTAALGSLRPGDFIGFLSYLPATDDMSATLQELRATIRDRLAVATTAGVGPRYLHSTGQYHKGGPDTGIFFLLTSDDEDDVPIPGTPYSFGVLKRAQAVGDFQALEARGRRVVRLHLVGQRERHGEILGALIDDALAHG